MMEHVNAYPHTGHVRSVEAALKDTGHFMPRRERSSSTFTGREDILKLLNHVFNSPEPPNGSRREFRLCGSPGVGKSQIALRFTELSRNK